MSLQESVSIVPSRNRTVASGSEKFSAVASDSEGSDWFGEVARGLLGKDAGFALAKLTGRPEGSCYKYCTEQEASRRMPPGFLVIEVLRSPQGGQWLAAFMAGSAAEWWLDLEKVARAGRAAQAELQR